MEVDKVASINLYQTTPQLKVVIKESNFSGTLTGWNNEMLALHKKPNTTYTGFVWQGSARLTTSQGEFVLQEGMYFMVSGQVKLQGNGQGFVIAQPGYQGIFMLGGPVEQKGRLQYIDGCTDTLLIAPATLGDPCFNLLHIPANTFQSQHTHPSFRVGMIVSGAGECITPEGNFALSPGQVFYIPKDGRHSFKTTHSDLRVVAYHPDSDFGPTHQNHPMINRTIL
ncbi:cupin domain-containing protein [uncultured Microscilla sp.]|uniref:cupin domain-containing protein n=1 Tax=uncultured Microscilla sp. TaxID=432653 RepID=UPI00260F25FA|nr:cupin domain-containing protein [uncultured Microscilla sp.]